MLIPRFAKNACGLWVPETCVNPLGRFGVCGASCCEEGTNPCCILTESPSISPDDVLVDLTVFSYPSACESEISKIWSVPWYGGLSSDYGFWGWYCKWEIDSYEIGGDPDMLLSIVVGAGHRYPDICRLVVGVTMSCPESNYMSYMIEKDVDYQWGQTYEIDDFYTSSGSGYMGDCTCYFNGQPWIDVTLPSAP